MAAQPSGVSTTPPSLVSSADLLRVHSNSSSLSLRRRTPHTLPLLQREGSSHRRQFSTNFSIVNPSHGLQLFTNCLSVAPSHGVQCFRNRLLQHGSRTGSQALPANLLWRGLLSPRVCSSCQEPAPAWGSPWGHSFLQASPCSGVGSLPWATGGDLLHHGPPWTAGRQPASPWSSSQAAREGSLLRHFRHLPPPTFFTDLGVCRVVSLLSSHSSLFNVVSPPSLFLLFLKDVITEALPLALTGLALASGRSVLEPAGTGSIRHGGSFSQLLTEATPVAPPLPKSYHANPEQHASLGVLPGNCLQGRLKILQKHQNNIASLEIYGQIWFWERS